MHIIMLTIVSSLFLLTCNAARQKTMEVKDVSTSSKNTSTPEKKAVVKEPKTLAEYDEIIETAKKNGKHVAVKFQTSWCSFCQKPELKHIFNTVADLGNFVFIHIDGDNKEFTKLKQKHGVSGYPTTIVISAETDKVHTVKGADAVGIQNTIRRVSKGQAPNKIVEVTEKENKGGAPTGKNVEKKSKKSMKPSN
jgi:thiol:disulfide interchange protein